RFDELFDRGAPGARMRQQGRDVVKQNARLREIRDRADVLLQVHCPPWRPGGAGDCGIPAFAVVGKPGINLSLLAGAAWTAMVDTFRSRRLDRGEPGESGGATGARRGRSAR